MQSISWSILPIHASWILEELYCHEFKEIILRLSVIFKQLTKTNSAKNHVKCERAWTFDLVRTSANKKNNNNETK